jgi:hypothetical protein
MTASLMVAARSFRWRHNATSRVEGGLVLKGSDRRAKGLVLKGPPIA